MRCTYCGSRQHTEKNCPKTHAGSARRATMRCTYCGASNHFIEACPKTAHSKNNSDDYRVEDK